MCIVLGSSSGVGSQSPFLVTVCWLSSITLCLLRTARCGDNPRIIISDGSNCARMQRALHNGRSVHHVSAMVCAALCSSVAQLCSRLTVGYS